MGDSDRTDKAARQVAAFFLAALIVTAYANSLQGVYLYDDNPNIVENEKIESLRWPWRFCENTRRPFLYLSLALNRTFTGTSPVGFHVVNILIHVLAAFFLWDFLNTTFQRMKGWENERMNALGLSWAAAAFWAVHPIQTQSVTYIIQRAESLSGMFALAAAASAARYFSLHQVRWLFPAAVCFFLSGMTKEVAFGLPVILVLYDRGFFCSRWTEVFRRHAALYLSFVPTWFFMLFLWATTRPEAVPTAGFSYEGSSPGLYALNQSRVILHYLRLFFWPNALVFDYEWRPQGWAELWPSVLLFVALGVTLIRLWRTHPRWSFAGAAFFILLAPSSSFIPIRDLAFEHRMYLPSAVLSVLFVQGLWRAVSWRGGVKAMRAIIGILLMLLVGLTAHRNSFYTDERRLWADVVAKRPQNSRAQGNYGVFLMEDEEYEKAAVHLQEAMRLNPYEAQYVKNLANLYNLTDRPEKAMALYQRAVRLKPFYPTAYNSLGDVYWSQGRYEEARRAYEVSLEQDPLNPIGHNSLGVVLMELGRWDEALEHFNAALALDPAYEKAKRNKERLLSGDSSPSRVVSPMTQVP